MDTTKNDPDIGPTVVCIRQEAGNPGQMADTTAAVHLLFMAVLSFPLAVIPLICLGTRDLFIGAW